MKIKFISNACAIFESDKGTKILSDPWIVNGVFEGSWCHFHKLETKIEDLQDVDAIYVSHIHPDHYDERFFDFSREIPIIVLDHGLNFLHKKLIEKGYKNLIKVKDKQTINFKDIKISLFAPFVKHVFFGNNTKIGNLIDSAIVLESDNQVVFNANDNNPDNLSCELLKERFEKIDLAMINYNNAGPYPSCFNNLTDEEKLKEHQSNLKRNIDFLASNLEILQPKFFLPFAGAYVIGGKLHYKNNYLGTTTWDDCIERLQLNNSLKRIDFIALREKDIFDITNKKLLQEYIPINNMEVNSYIKEELSKLIYPYEEDDYPSITTLKNDLEISKSKLEKRMEKINIVPDMDVNLELDNAELWNVVKAKNKKGVLNCKIDLRLLRRIIDRKSHWNNAEIGCHIEFYRTPNYYSPDIHTMMQFFHL